MRRLFALIIGCLFLGTVPVAADNFLPGTEDVPLMPGLHTADDKGLVFDKPQGRIVEVTAEGALQRAAVIAFYRASLPPLGWNEAGAQRFERDGERLSLDFSGTDGHLTVSFALSPL